MSYDLLVGLSAPKLDQAIAQVYGNASLRESLFKGSKSVNLGGSNISVAWDVQSAPAFQLSPPSADEWKIAVKGDGSKAPPQNDAFMVNLAKLKLQITASAGNLDTTIPVKIICTADSSTGRILLKALAVIVNLSDASDTDKFIIRSILIPGLLDTANKSLNGFNIPSPSIPGISLTPPVADVQNNHLLVAFNLLKDGTPNLSGVNLPDDSFFILMSPELTNYAINYVVKNNVQGKSFSKSGSVGGGGFSANYNATGRINSIGLNQISDPTRLKANISLGLNAGAGIDTPVGYIIKGGEIVYEGVKDVVEKILDPDTWNPTKW